MPNLGQKIITKFASDNAKFLFLSAAAGWILASAAQTLGIAASQKIDKEDKKFLIPQELADGAANIGLYALFTVPLMMLTEYVVGSGKFIKFKGAAPNSPELKNITDGAKVIASFVGAVVSSNVLTPIVRNKLGTIAQRKALRQKVQINDPSYDPYYQPFFQKSYGKIPLKMNNYITFTRNQGMKI